MAEQQSFFSRLAQDPAIKGLASSIGDYATAKGKDLAKSKMPGPEEASGIIDAGKKEAKREAVVPAVKGFFKGAWAKLRGGSKGGKRPINIVETALIGAPVEQVWDTWLDFKEWPNFMKGPEKIEAGKEEADDGSDVTNWTAKIFWSRRSWKSTVTEQVDYERLRWKSEGAKGTVDGMVSFAPAGENLTFCVLVLEYRPKGFNEWVAKLWRAQGRRARLDFKHFQRHVAMADQAGQLEGGNGEAEGDERGPDDDGAAGDRDAERAGDSTGTGPAGEPGAAGDGEPEPGVGEDQGAPQQPARA